MKLVSAHIEDLRTLYISNLRKALDMEQKISKALPEVIEKVSDPELSTALSNHLEETRGHVAKVQALLQRNTDDDSTETCKVIGSLTTEASDTIKDVTNPQVRDIALIGAAQQVEHHEIAVYGTLSRWAENPGPERRRFAVEEHRGRRGEGRQTANPDRGEGELASRGSLTMNPTRTEGRAPRPSASAARGSPPLAAPFRPSRPPGACPQHIARTCV